VILAIFLRVGAKSTRKPFVVAVKKDVIETDLLADERDFE